MELEEQKSKNVLLDREIKTETMNLLEYVKEEPLEEEDYFELLIPKHETEFSLENVKEEPIDEEDYSELKVPKQETAELFGNVKEEPIDEEYFDQIIPKQDFSELLIPKRELEGFLESVKEEPRDEEDYSELLVSKHEEVIEPSASYMSKNPIQKSFIETQEDVPKVHESRKRSMERFRCSTCLQKYPRQNVKCVTMEEDKLVIMLGCILNGSFTIDQARLFMSGRRVSSRRVFICYVHFTEVINKIYDLFNIKNLEEITLCSSELMNNLVVTVNTVCPEIKTASLSGIIYKFVRRNSPQERKHINTQREQSKIQQNNRCSVCTQNESNKNMKFVTMEEDKLIIMVGCILRGDCTHEEAHSFMSQKKRTYICYIHFSEALNQIYKALHIKHPHETFSCSVELMTNLMITVNKLCPQIEPCQFRISLKTFFTRNKHFIQIF